MKRNGVFLNYPSFLLYFDEKKIEWKQKIDQNRISWAENLFKFEFNRFFWMADAFYDFDRTLPSQTIDL